MSYKFIKDLTSVNRTKGGNTKKYIVIHYTGNKTDTAKANANYFRNINRGASAHYFVDKTTVYQVVEDDDRAWAVGRNFGSKNLFNIVTNKNSISIEMCSDNGRIAEETFNNTVTLTKSLMKKYNIPASNVIRHWDVCSKCCPGWNGWGANGKDASIWNKFKTALTTTTIVSNPQKAGTAKNNNQLYYRAHIQSHGTLSVVRDGQTMGSTGYGLRMEGFWLDTRAIVNKYPNLIISADYHCQKIGDKHINNVKHDSLIGTTGKGLRLEAFRLIAKGLPEGVKLKYQTHVQGIGWQSICESGEWAGTKGQSKRIEAVRIWIE